MFPAYSRRLLARRSVICTTIWPGAKLEPRTRRTGLITKSDRRTAVAIVGGGASGTMLAAQLARRGIQSLLIDGSGRAGRGVAYSTSEDVHLLNVRAEGMSAWAGEPDHFAKHFAKEGGRPREFAQRRLFGRYLGDVLDEAVKSQKTQVLHATALRASRSDKGWIIGLDDGSAAAADILVLASGNQEPEALAPFAGLGRRFIGDPWGEDAKAAVENLASTGEPALLVGTGLTMVDVALSLDAAGHRGKIVALSRRGLAPRSHADFTPAPARREEIPQGLGALWRWLRWRGAQVGWRAAVDSLRPHSHFLWRSLTDHEQKRFLRHARPWWDVHRHRIAPEVTATIAQMVGQGRLEIVAGRIVDAKETADAIRTDYRRRHTNQVTTQSFAYVFNCTGPLHAIGRSKDPFVRSLLDSKEVTPDHLGIGLDVDANCRAGEHLWAMGQLTKGHFWEIVAVPDIREQAAVVADDIQRELEL
ncbi:MAG TPA: FAD/NAD(P)-binding protein [Sphingomicrobium sp.]|nr:FAD/NAD(P)-binding protein [Sphingomicrobium sp.]